MMSDPDPKPTPALTIDVDVANPGQFFACCGLLELASRLDEEALGWFEGSQFYMQGSIDDLLSYFLHADITPILISDGVSRPSPPIQIGKPFDMSLNWWEDEAATRSGFKTWSGGQTVMGFVDGMRKCVSQRDTRCDGLLSDAIAISQPKPFYFDSRLSRLTAIDMGFSTEKFTAAFAPGVELFTLVGLQRFRPITVKPRERYGYQTWCNPLPVRLAAAVAHGLIPTLSHQEFVFPLVVRTGGKYKAFGPSTPTRSNHA